MIWLTISLDLGGLQFGEEKLRAYSERQLAVGFGLPSQSL
jgi:hypothetical protein